MRERLGKRMGIHHISTAFVVSMLALVPFSIASMDGELEHIQQPSVMHSTDENASGWLASAGGASYERVRAMVPLANGSMMVGGMFEQSIELYSSSVLFFTRVV